MDEHDHAGSLFEEALDAAQKLGEGNMELLRIRRIFESRKLDRAAGEDW
jgi:hypothetical protein